MSKKQCSICCQFPTNLLILSCCHALCLKCAFEKIHQHNKNQLALKSLKSTNSQQFKSQQNLIIQCSHQFCYQTTTITCQLYQQIKQSLGFKFDKSYKQHSNKCVSQTASIQQINYFQRNSDFSQNNEALIYLNKMRSQYLNVNRQSQQEKGQIQYPISYSRNNNHNYFEKINKVFSQNDRIFQIKNNFDEQSKENKKFSTKIFCSDHPDYQVLYVCSEKECFKIICPECVINGKHRTHSYLSFKNIINQNLPQLLSNLTSNLIKKTTQVEKYQQIEQNQFRSQIDEVLILRKQTKKYYDQIKQRIRFQQKQAQLKCQELQYKIKQEKKQKEKKMQEIHDQLQRQMFELKQIKTEMQEVTKFISKIYSTSKFLDSNNLSLFELKNMQLKLVEKYLNLENKNLKLVKQNTFSEMDQLNKNLIQKNIFSETCQSNRQILLNRNFNLLYQKNNVNDKQKERNIQKQNYESLKGKIQKDLSKIKQKHLTTKQRQLFQQLKNNNQYNINRKSKFQQQLVISNQNYFKLKQKYQLKEKETEQIYHQKFNSTQIQKKRQLKKQNNQKQKEENLNKSLNQKINDTSPLKKINFTPLKIKSSQNDKSKDERIQNNNKTGNRKIISQPLPIFISKSMLNSKQFNKENKNNKNISFSKSRKKCVDQRDNQLLYKFKIS